MQKSIKFPCFCNSYCSVRSKLWHSFPCLSAPYPWLVSLHLLVSTDPQQCLVNRFLSRSLAFMLLYLCHQPFGQADPILPYLVKIFSRQFGMSADHHFTLGPCWWQLGLLIL